MKKPWAVFIIAVIAAMRAVPCEAQTDEIAFTHVAVVDVQSGNISPDMTVLISGQKIREVGSSRVVHVPKQAHSADAHGKYLMLGLWDRHFQLVECRAARYVLPPVSCKRSHRRARDGRAHARPIRYAGETRSLPAR